MKTNFKVGQEVECLIYGKGVVISDRDKSGLSCDYPVEVKFLMKNPNDAFGIEYKIETYTADGRLYTDSNISSKGTFPLKSAANCGNNILFTNSLISIPISILKSNYAT